VQYLHASLRLIAVPEFELIKARFKLVAADVVEYAASPVFQVEDVLMQRLEICLFNALTSAVCLFPDRVDKTPFQSSMVTASGSSTESDHFIMV
jgi:hypothetical protein